MKRFPQPLAVGAVRGLLSLYGFREACGRRLALPHHALQRRREAVAIRARGVAE